MGNRTDNNRLIFRTMILWFAIFVLASFACSTNTLDDSITMTVIPEVPRENTPIIVTYSLNNPGSETSDIQYQFYANGQVVMSGSTVLEPKTSKQFQYTYLNPLELGEQVTFMVKTQSDNGNHDKIISLPAYPPQVWSSFVSFATFSTSLMSSTSVISSMGFYDETFSTSDSMNVGLVFSIVLIILLIYLELTEPKLLDRTFTIIGDLRVRFSRLSAILFVIFVGIVFTQIAMIVGGIR